MLIRAPQQPDLLLQAIYAHIEDEAAKEPKRHYIGASSIGDDCELKLWMQFRYPQLAKRRKAELIMAANDGHHSELVIADYIGKIPQVELITRGADGKQLGFSDLDGLYKGHYDGMIIGVPQAPKTMHIWEHKSKNEKYYDKLTTLKNTLDEKEVLKEWDYSYYCQAVVYMEYSGASRHYMTVAKAGTRALQSLRTNENPALAKLLREKAQRIINYPSQPVGISENPSFWKCKWCDFSESCPSINKNITLPSF